MTARRFKIGFLAFNGVTQLDLTGPYEVLSKVPNIEVIIVAKSGSRIRADSNFTFKPHKTLRQSKKLDVLVIPGGPGVNKILNDKEIIDYVREISLTAKYITSVCTGALVLGAACLLKGKRAATHWTAREFLEEFGAIPSDDRVVKDGNVITGGGVTAGIDFAFQLVAEIAGRETAELIQLSLEYNPQPPFNAGSPDTTPQEIVQAVQDSIVTRQEERRLAVMKAAKKLNL